MTRIALISDIHGNLPALESVMADMKQFAPDHVVVAGDMVNWGPFSTEVMQVVTENRWTTIRGNNEYYVINAKSPRRPAQWSEFTLLEWLHDQLTDWVHVIAGLPDDLLLLYPDAPDVHMCHGIPENCWKGIYPPEHDADEQIKEWLLPARAKTIFCGHTHIPINRRVGEYHIINPGTVGVPLLGESVSSYMILDGNENGWSVAEHRTLPLDSALLLPAWEAQDFAARCGVVAVMVMEEFKQSRLMVHSFNMWMKELYPTTQTMFEHGEAFLMTDPTPYIPAQYRF